MGIGEVLLRKFSRPPGSGDFDSGIIQDTPGNELTLLRQEFPAFSAVVRGKRVVDFGSGAGLQSLALAAEEGCFVCGIDSNERSLRDATALAAKRGIPAAKVMFVVAPTADMLGSFDVVISQNAMEHFQDPVAVLNVMKTLINRTGRILITFGPPWFAPYGAHMYYFSRVPWINLLFAEKTVMKVRSSYRTDGATRYEEVESGLNRMSIARFERIVTNSGLVMESRNYSCIKRMNWLAAIPVLRELFINNVSCVLRLA